MARADTPFRVIWTESASRDLNGIVAYAAARSPTDARDLLSRLRRWAKALERRPERGRLVPELTWFGVRSFREVIEHPYRLLYRVMRKEVRVLALLDGRRDLSTLLLDCLLRED